MTKLERIKSGEPFYFKTTPFKEFFRVIENFYITLDCEYHCSISLINDKEIKVFSRILNKSVNETVLLDDIKFHDDDKEL